MGRSKKTDSDVIEEDARSVHGEAATRDFEEVSGISPDRVKFIMALISEGVSVKGSVDRDSDVKFEFSFRPQETAEEIEKNEQTNKAKADAAQKHAFERFSAYADNLVKSAVETALNARLLPDRVTTPPPYHRRRRNSDDGSSVVSKRSSGHRKR